MQNNEQKAGTAAEKRTAADSIPSASLVQNGMLADAVQEGNRLIYEFMGYPTTLSSQRYDKKFEWDNLMPVVEKIEQLGYDSRIHGNDSDGGFLCDFVDVDNNEVACVVTYRMNGASKIEAVWGAVVEFVKWYNAENNKSE